MSDSEVDATERLFAEFEAVHDLPTIAAVVHQAHEDVQYALPGALPALMERLARQRLSPPDPAL